MLYIVAANAFDEVRDIFIFHALKHVSALI